MAKSYVINGTNGGPGVDNTSEVVLEADSDGNPTKVIGTTTPSTLTKTEKETLASLGFSIGESDVSAEEAAAAPQVGSDTQASGPRISG